jgi:uncharacterized protein (DUF488 family)
MAIQNARNVAAHLILGILLESKHPVSKIRLMKLLFLLHRETPLGKSTTFYEFLPYKYGPYSFSVSRDLDKWMSEGMIVGEVLDVATGRKSAAADSYRDMVPLALRQELRGLVTKHQFQSDDQLINDVYARYPRYTVLSERIQPRPKRTFAKPAIYTIGYEGHSIDGFFRTLIEERMARLIDVRRVPLSRKPGFSKKMLALRCSKIGVEYVHFPEVGIASDQRQNLSDFASYQRLLDRYEKTLPKKESVIAQIALLSQEKPSALMCFEADVRCCHRSRLASCLTVITGLPLRHLKIAADGECDGEKESSHHGQNLSLAL